MSRTPERRGPRQLASIVEDATVLLSAVLASPVLVPAAVRSARTATRGMYGLLQQTGFD